jgi:hypothetical protein
MSWYALNKFVWELQYPEPRVQYEADPAGFVARYDLTSEEVAAVRARDIRAMWLLGVNPYLLRFFQLRHGVEETAFHEALRGLTYLDSVKEEKIHG